ncbi:MAG TPA: hypothetical protein VJ694_00985 [Patescibacteria group bacterium]|nr:hypothetical protein [Patescibacteria group bacterium]
MPSNEPPLMKSGLQEADDLENRAAELDRLAELYQKEAVELDRKVSPLDYMLDPAGRTGNPQEFANEKQAEANKYRDEAEGLRKQAEALRKSYEDAEGPAAIEPERNAPIESVLPDLGKGSDGPAIPSVIPDIGKASWRKPDPRLAALGLAVLAAVLGLFMLAQKKNPEAPKAPQAVIGADGSYDLDGKKYYRVVSTDPAGDTGNEVCARAGKTCVGYTALTQSVCMAFHPGATPSEDFNGSKAGFYCDGAPQGGICAQESNTCHICPACNLNMECDTVIGDLYRETFVECK